MSSDGSTERVGGTVSAGPMDADSITTSTRDAGQTAMSLEKWLVSTLPNGSNPKITDVTSPESNGMSSETLLFNAEWTDDGALVDHQLVARIEPPSTDYPVFTTYDMGMQFRVMRLVEANTSVPVPKTHWYEEDPTVLGGPFFVMDRVDGKVPPDVLPYTFGDNWVFDGTDEDRRTIQESAIQAMAGIHSIVPTEHDLDFLQLPDQGNTSLERILNHWVAYKDWVVADEPSELLTDCFAWLQENLPEDASDDALSWGDGRIGNMMFRDNKVVAVLDWEMASVAPPEVDLGWMCYLHLFFQDLAMQLGVAGLPDMFQPKDVRDSYIKASGTEIGNLKWHIAFAAMRHGAIMRRVTERSVHFGEAIKPDSIDDLIIHRDTLRAMIDGTYWEQLAF